MTFSRFRLPEITPSRVNAALKRRIDEIPHSISWNFYPQSSSNKKGLKNFQNYHQGQRCFIMGNGPSLAKMDLSHLSNEITFGLNRIYLLFDKISFKPTYYVCINELILEQFVDEIKMLYMPKFLNWNRRSFFKNADTNTFFIKQAFGIRDYFEKSPLKPLPGGSTVTYTALQIAFYMGFSKVILIGVDHNFTEKGTPNSIVVRTSEQDQSHFDLNYFPKGVQWQLPDLYHSEISYELARKAFLNEGRQILDATVNGRCRVFEKVDYHSLFTSE
jgi:hypothetical protein